VFEAAMELYWSGVESASIARQLNIPVGTIYSWVHDFGSSRERKEPLKKLLCTAKSAEEWRSALRENTVLLRHQTVVIFWRGFLFAIKDDDAALLA